MTTDRLRVIVALSILVAWLILIFVDAAKSDYEVPFQVHAAMLLVAGYLFAPSVIKAGKRVNGEGGHD